MDMHMDEAIEDGNAFAIPDLYKSSSLANSDVTPQVEVLQPLDPLDEPHVNLPFSEDLKSGLLDLPTFDYGPVEDVGVLENSSISSLESLDTPEIVEEDVWICLQPTKDHGLSASLKSWEIFYDKRPQELTTSFLSEGGPDVFDAAIVKSAESASPESLIPTSGHVIQSEALLSSLKQLALGRESILYCYIEEERSFRLRHNDIRISGYSLETLNSLSEALRVQGNRVRHLQDFIAQTQLSSMASPVHVALAGAFAPILSFLEAQIGSPPMLIRTLLQLQALVKRPGQVLVCLSDVVAKIQGVCTDEDLLSRIYELMQNAENSPAWLSSTLHGLLMAASRPWLESVDDWLGLQHQGSLIYQPNYPSFAVAEQKDAAVDVRSDAGITDFEFEPFSMPSFISTEDALTIFETGRSLRLLEVHQPDHPLTKLSGLPSDKSPKLEWQFSWQDIEEISTKANEYESSLRNALEDFYSGSIAMDEVQILSSDLQHPKHTVADPKQSAQAFIDASTAAIKKPLPELSTSPQPSSEDTNLDASSTFAPPVSLLPTLSFTPLISARARLINYATLRLLFQTHHLRSHLSLLHRYTLMSDGLFTSRLSHALFSPSLPTTERQPGHPRSGPTGLKLGHRDIWPPASSELRLALMGVLTESYFTTSSSCSSVHDTSLPGNLSFAIRTLTPTELESCSDPNTLPALDFLRLTYNPPPPLDTIITPTSLQKYDTIFKLLLRLLRMLFVATQLSQTDTRTPRFVRGARDPWAGFRIESAHFVRSVCGYFFDGVETHWRILDRKLQSLEKITEDLSHIGDAGRDGESINKLKEFHEQCLDRMMLSLLLRKRQGQVMALLEEVFGVVLRFSWLVSSSSGIEIEKDEDAGKRDAEIKELYLLFQRKARVFVDVCRGLSEQRGWGGTKTGGEEGENTLGQLVVRFEMNGFYAR